MTHSTKSEIRRCLLEKSGQRDGKEVLENIPWSSMGAAIGEALKSLLRGRDGLRKAAKDHMEKSTSADKDIELTFALDGRLVGDIGELIAAEKFCLGLLGTKSKSVDAKTTSGPSRRVQIKATFQNDGLSLKHGADYFIGLQFNDQGQFRVVYNGPARTAMNYRKAPATANRSGRTHAGKRLESLKLTTWAVLNSAVNDTDRIPLRTAS